MLINAYEVTAIYTSEAAAAVVATPAAPAALALAVAIGGGHTAAPCSAESPLIVITPCGFYRGGGLSGCDVVRRRV